jgi:hypothetical protein
MIMRSTKASRLNLSMISSNRVTYKHCLMISLRLAISLECRGTELTATRLCHLH